MLGIFATPATPAEVPMIFPDELNSMLGKPDMVIIDVRLAEAWRGSDRKIKGAVWEDPKNIESWADNYPKELKLVLY